jgi:small subunit ribosomal protein S8
MAKTSMIERNNKRRRLAKKFKTRRTRLKAIAADRSLPAEERFAARLKLAELPRNSSPTRIRNRCDLTGRPRGYYRKLRMSRIALREYKTKVTTPASKLREHVLDVLAEEGYIRGYARVDYSGGRSEFEIELKYFDGEPVIKDIKRVSTPGRRVYSSVKDLPTVANGLGVAILSTPKGVMSDSRARTENVGGEILCNVF